MNKIITIRVTQEDFEYITNECKKERLPKSAWIRRKLLFEEIDNKKTLINNRLNVWNKKSEL